MATRETQRRAQQTTQFKSAVAAAAIVGALGGWVAFGTNQTSIDAASSQVAAVSNVTVASDSASIEASDTTQVTTVSNTVSSAASSSASSSAATTTRPVPVANTRSSS